ncbi:melanoma antigen preferentially expressed in tumors-like [Dipodomys merriami]|uniref:melanoma antigen preferentially expressed in tumors-like n=1 Tax=Dipodomys merriami TaxID=94247 RepID=UPI003855CE87
MDPKEPGTLLDLAVQTLMNNEPLAIHALEEIPRELFIPLFIAAVSGGHKKILKAIVSMWPFHCLHVGTLNVQESYCEIVEALIDGLQFLPVHSSSRVPKLRILDLRQDTECKTTCSDFLNRFPLCFQSCVYSPNSILKLQGARPGFSNSESELQLSRQPMEVLVDLYLDGTVKTWQLLSVVLGKVEQSFGSLHLCCRDLQIDKVSECRSTLKFLDLVCIDHLGVHGSYLSEVCSILAQMIHLDSLSLSKITFRSYKGKSFRAFLTHLGRMDSLQELSLAYFSVKDQLHKILRVLSPELDFLYLNVCDLTTKDFTSLSQSFQTSRLRVLNLSNNQITWEDSQPLRILLEKLSGTLKHLEINSCLITDTILSSLIPAIRSCSLLHVLGFASNPITMPMLRNIFPHITALKDLKYVLYPIPVHCYDQWGFRGSLDRQKLSVVKSQLKVMLQAAERNDMKWTTSYA